MIDVWHFKFKFAVLYRSVNWAIIKGLFFNKYKNITKHTAYHKGRAQGAPKLVRQRRARYNNTYLRDNVSIPLFKTIPTLSINMIHGLHHGRTTSLQISSSGISFFSTLLNYGLFCFHYFDFWKFHPKFTSVISDKWFRDIKLGSRIINIRDYLDNIPLYSRSTGSYSRLLSYEPWAGTYLVKLSSGSMKFFLFLSMASIFNKKRDMLRTSKREYLNAGTSANLGNRPKVRGVAMNPVDHPHGGRTKSIKLHRTPWGLITK